MHDEFHRAAVVACRIILKPVVRLLLRYGLSCKEFCEISKRIYVDVAMETSDSGANISNIAVKTGISRKEVGKLANSEDDPTFSTPIGILPIRLMSIWFSDPEYLDATGSPIPLQMRGSSGPTLESLIDKVAVDAPRSSIVKELLESGAITLENENYIAKSRLFVYKPKSGQAITKLACDIASLADTVTNNFEKHDENIDSSPDIRFQQSSYSLKISKENSKLFSKYMRAHAEAFLEKMDTTLTRLEDTDMVEEKYYTGVGVYYFRSEIGKDIKSALLDHYSSN